MGGFYCAYDLAGPAGFAPKVRISATLLCALDNKKPFRVIHAWLDRQDSNLRMLGPKPSALPLGDGPISINITIKILLRKPRGGKVVGFLKFYKSKEDIIDDR